MTLTVRARVRNALIAAAALLGAAGVVVVASFPPGANNVGLDCRLPPDGGGGGGECVALLQPPTAQCPALMATFGEPPGAGLDAGFPNASVRLERALEAMRTNGAIETWHCQPAVVDAGSGCGCEIRGTVSRGAGGKLDGQAAAWRDALDAQGAGSVVVPGDVSARPPWARNGACRSHVFAGEDPCASSSGVDGGPEPDGGP